MTDRPRITASRLGPRSLTARLIVGVVSLVLILVVAISSSTYYLLARFLAQRLDQQLSATVPNSLSQLYRGVNPGTPVRNPQDVYVAGILRNSNGLLYVQDRNVDKMKLSADDVRRLANWPPNTPTSVVTKDGVDLRVETTPVIYATFGGPPEPVVTVIGLPTADEHKTMSVVLRDEVIIGIAALLVAFLATSYGVRFSLRHLRRVTDTADEVSAELSPTGAGLERRVDVPNDGTEVGRLAESMNKLLATVEAQFAARLQSEDRLRQFLADASHELRTPLTSIRGYAELARMQRDAGADAEDNLARIESEGTRMSRLVEDLLMLARGDQMSPARNELVDVGELLAEAVDSARAAFPDRPIDAQLTPDLHVVGDPDQLYRIVRNLVGNAEMHTAKGRPVLVRCLRQGLEVLIQVIDGGPGLPPEEAAHVFERFWRADKARSRARGGTGLGMSIVAAIVAAHGGSVAFVSSVEQGSTVTVRLPAVEGSSDDLAEEALGQPIES